MTYTADTLKRVLVWERVKSTDTQILPYYPNKQSYLKKKNYKVKYNLLYNYQRTVTRAVTKCDFVHRRTHRHSFCWHINTYRLDQTAHGVFHKNLGTEQRAL